MEEYRYEPLPSATSIRLIKPEPGTPGNSQDDGTLCFTFIVTDISNPPEYTALSYTWGDASNTVPILLSGKTLHITQNLHDALKYFSTRPVPLWADALSINQQDIPEKNHQVNRMGDIYRKATDVGVWLGSDGHNDAPAIFQTTKDLINACKTITDASGQFGHVDDETGGLHWQSQEGQNHVLALPKALVDPNEDERARLERFLKLPWFSRTWTLQEVGLSAFAVMVWGRQAIGWHLVGVTAMFLKRFCGTLLNKLHLTEEIDRVWRIYTVYSPLVYSATFFHVLNYARCFQATDPRDKIFALMSHPTARTVSAEPRLLNWNGFELALPMAIRFLSGSTSGRNYIARLAAEGVSPDVTTTERSPTLVQVDYTKSTEEIYHELALGDIKRTGSLEILTAVQHDPESTCNLFTPSWVPRWDYFINAPVMGLYTSGHLASATKSVIMTSPPRDMPNSLIVRGTLLTRIIGHTHLIEESCFDLPLPADTGPESPLVQSIWSNNPIAYVWLQKLMLEEPDSYPVLPLMTTGTGEDLLYMYDTAARSVYKAYVSTWVAGKGLDEVDGFNPGGDSEAYWERLFWGSKGIPENRPSPSEDDSEREKSKSNTNWQRYRDSAAVVCNKRKFFFTKKKFFGLGPGALQTGDFIAVLLGADVPFVVREVPEDGEESEELRRMQNQPIPMDRKFRLIGECYVNGLMQGQATRGQEFTRDITLI